jgi:hypothetical protein
MENAAVTNEPGLRGMVPLSNSARCGGGGASVDFSGIGNKASERGEKRMKAVIDRLLNHLGLDTDAVEAVVLEKLALLPTLSAATVLQNSLTTLQTAHDALVLTVKGYEGEIVNRHLAEFAPVITDASKAFWTEQLMTNRAGAVVALGELKELAGSGKGEAEPTPGPSTEGMRKPLHNRGAVKVLPPGQAGAEGDSKAVKIRNRAQEIAVSEKVPFGVAFRRAERELSG